MGSRLPDWRFRPSDIADAIGRAMWRTETCRRSLPFYQLHSGKCVVDSGQHTQLLYRPRYGSASCLRLTGRDGPCRHRLWDGQVIERALTAPYRFT